MAVVIGLVSVLTMQCDFSDMWDDDHDGKYTATAAFNYSIPADEQIGFSIAGVSGDIQITGTGDQSRVIVQGERMVRADSRSRADDGLDDLQVMIEKSDTLITVYTDQPESSDNVEYIVNYQVEMPAAWICFAGNVNGDFVIDSLDNDCTANNINGDIWIGHVNDANIYASGLNGDITFIDIHGNVTAQIINGDIDGQISIPLNGVCQLTMVNGDIDLEIPKATSATLSAAVSNGNITLNDLVLNNRVVTPTTLTGRLGEGRGIIHLAGTNGNINIGGY